MINNKKVLGIIPARGGSKRLPGKNIKLFAGKPLIAWTIEETKKSKYIDRLILSSENENIIKIAKKYNCEVPFIRPKELAQDNTPGIDPVLHAIETLDKKYDYVILLQPTSPLRTAHDIDFCITKCVKEKIPSCVSVTTLEADSRWMFTMDSNGKFIPLFPFSESDPPESLPIIYKLNGAIYIAELGQLLDEGTFINNYTIPYIMEPIRSIDIDNNLDFEFCEFLVNKINPIVL